MLRRVAQFDWSAHGVLCRCRLLLITLERCQQVLPPPQVEWIWVW